MLTLSTFEHEGRLVAVGFYLGRNIAVPVAFYRNQLGFWTADNESGVMPDKVFASLPEAFLECFLAIRRVLG